MLGLCLLASGAEWSAVTAAVTVLGWLMMTTMSMMMTWLTS